MCSSEDTIIRNNETGTAIEATSVHCPHCGVQAIYVDTADGDVYLGPSWVCADCGWEFSYHAGGTINPEKRDGPLAVRMSDLLLLAREHRASLPEKGGTDAR